MTRREAEFVLRNPALYPPDWVNYAREVLEAAERQDR